MYYKNNNTKYRFQFEIAKDQALELSILLRVSKNINIINNNTKKSIIVIKYNYIIVFLFQ